MSCVKDKAKVPADKDPSIYHERQSRELCAMHALNNLFQKAKTFTKKQLDELCRNLAPNAYINPHKSILGLGNYDVNVVMAALQVHGYDTLWFDKRRDPRDLRMDRVYGFILNIPSDLKWGMVHVPIQRKHWISVRWVKDSYYILDSKQTQPEHIGSEEELLEFLGDQIMSEHKELLVVVNQQYQRDVWRNNKPRDRQVTNTETIPSSTGQGEGLVESGV